MLRKIGMDENKRKLFNEAKIAEITNSPEVMSAVKMLYLLFLDIEAKSFISAIYDFPIIDNENSINDGNQYELIFRKVGTPKDKKIEQA